MCDSHERQKSKSAPLSIVLPTYHHTLYLLQVVYNLGYTAFENLKHFFLNYCMYHRFLFTALERYVSEKHVKLLQPYRMLSHASDVWTVLKGKKLPRRS